MQKIVILENIRSAYNVGNVIRTADALGWKVWLSGYTPSPIENIKVKKTSLGAEQNVEIQQFDYSESAIKKAKDLGITVIAAETTVDATPLQAFSEHCPENIAIVFGNEVEGILPHTLELVDEVVLIPMQGIKESLNIGQSSAIFMRALQS